MQIQTKLLAALSVTSEKLAALAVTTGKIAADAVTGAKVLLANMESLRARNAAGSADVNVLRVNAADQVEGLGAWVFPDANPKYALAPAVDEDLANKAYVDSVAGSVTGGYQSIILNNTNITDQYVDLAAEAKANTLQVVYGGVVQRQSTDYTVSVVGGVTRVTFIGELATGGDMALVNGDVLEAQYIVA